MMGVFEHWGSIVSHKASAGIQASCGRLAVSDELERERALLRILEKSHANGDLSDEEYEATKADIEARIAGLDGDPGGAAEQKPADKSGCGTGCLWFVVAIIALFVAVSIPSCIGGGDGEGGGSEGGAGGPLLESEAEVACERVVRDQLDGHVSFRQGANWEIDGGWAVNGMVSHQGQEVGYSCDVTGPSGSHRVSNVHVG